mgnify:CR=1 FL=1
MSVKQLAISELNTKITNREYQLGMLKLAIEKERIGSELLFSFRRLCQDVEADIIDLKDQIEDVKRYR